MLDRLPRTTLLKSLLLTSVRRGYFVLRPRWFHFRQASRVYPISTVGSLPNFPPNMSDSNQPPILIVGAGLAGLSLAAILQKNNIPYFVFESSPRMRTQGHGLTLHPWAYLPLSQALDIDPGQLGSAVATDSAIGGRGVIDPQVHDVYSGRVMESGSETLASDTFNHAQSFRARKSAIGEFLLKRIDPSKMFWEWKLKTCDIRDGCVIAGFDNGESMTGRLLVAADGLHSAGMMVMF